MVEFEYQPWQKIIVHEVVKFPLQYFISSHSLGVEAGGIGKPLYWVDGLVFEKIAFEESDEAVKEKLEGKVHWNHLHYAIMEEYQSEIKISKGNIHIPVINASDHETYVEMAKWIKTNFEK
jgi:hypothetical protein